MEKITLEGAAESKYTQGVYVINGIDIYQASRECFIKGGEWMQERMYSDMQDYAKFCIECDRANLKPITAKDWFKYFKN